MPHHFGPVFFLNLFIELQIVVLAVVLRLMIIFIEAKYFDSKNNNNKYI